MGLLQCLLGYGANVNNETPTALTALSVACAKSRIGILQALLARQQKAAQQSMVGRTLGVLFEKPGREAGQMVGKSDYLHSVFVDSPDAQVGDLVQVRIVESAPNSLRGKLV